MSKTTAQLNIVKVVACLKRIKALQADKSLIEEVSSIKIEADWKSAIQLLFLSITAGDYYLFVCNRNLEEIKGLLDKISKPEGTFQQAFNQYLFLNQYIDDRCEERFYNIIYNVDINRNIYPRTKQEYDFYWLFNVNIKLALLDEGYSTNNDIVGQLSRIHHDLNYALSNKILIGYNELIIRLKSKSSILLYKLFKRKQKNQNLENYSSYYIFNDSTFEEIERELKEDEVGKVFIENIDSHYFNDDVLNYNDVINLCRTNNNFDIKKTSISSIHIFTKRVKQYLHQLEESGSFISENEKRGIEDCIKRIRKIISEKQTLSLSDKKFIKNSNTIVYISALNLINNCEFNLHSHFLLNNKNVQNKLFFNRIEFSFNSLKKKFEDCIDGENKNIENFILYKLYIEKLLVLIKIIEPNKSRLNSEEFDFENLIENLLSELKDKLRQYKNKVFSAKKYNLMPTYIEIENCINPNNKLFIDSQYILPSDYDFLLEKYDEIKDKITYAESIRFYIVPQNIKKAFKEEFKKEVKEHQYNIITIIGLYAAFVTFILSSGNLLAKSPEFSLDTILPSIIVIGFVLFYFIISLKILFTNSRSPFINAKVIWLILSLAVIIPGIYFVLKKCIVF